MRSLTWRALALLVVLGMLLAGCTQGGTTTDETEDAGGGADIATDDAAAGGETDDPAADTEEPAAGGDSTDVAQAPGGDSDTIAEIQDRGTLNCGVNGQLAGFSLNEGGTYTGFDADYCRAIAAVVLDDPEAVSYVDLTADTRFTALQSGEIDVLIRNSTWTASRDGDLGLAWASVTFYDGQGMLVPEDSPAEDLAGLEGATVCVQSGTTTELNLTSVFAAEGINYTPLLLPDEESITTSFAEGACQAYTTDRSGLASFATTFTDFPVRILDVTMSKEPLGPSVREGDAQWFDLVNWVVFATIQAEEFGLTQANIATAAEDFAENPEIVRFVGAGTTDDGGAFESGLAVPPDFAVRIVEAVGNYGEIYERNVTPLGLPRGLNSLWNAEEPGLLYAPPYR